MYLLDTNVISELRKARPHGGVRAWMSGTNTRELFLSAMVVGEIQVGIEWTRQQDVGKAAEIEAWVSSYRVLPLDEDVCREWARMMHRRSRALTEDAFIAATAKVNGLTLVTRNVRDFAGLGIELLNPFAGKASG